jgi:hypothetical protein
VIVVPYVGYLIGGDIPFINDPRGIAAVALILGFAACSVGASAARSAPIMVTIANVLGPVALGLGITTLITGNEWLLAGTIGTIVLLWIMATVRHAIYGRTTSTTPASPTVQAPMR